MSHRVTGAALLMMISCAAYAQKEATPGLYVGASATQARFDEDNFTVDNLDDEDTSWKAIAGLRFGQPFSLEATYIDFGETTAPGALGVDPFAAEAKAFVLQGIGYIPIPYVDIFAKAGAARIDAEGAGGGQLAFDDDTTEFAYGWGLQWRWQNFAVRGEYEKFDTDALDDLDLISLGFTYTFGLPMMSR